MSTKVASEVAELAMPGWKAVSVSSSRVDAGRKPAAPKLVDSRQVEVEKLREKYFGKASTPPADAVLPGSDGGEIVTLESRNAGTSGPKKLRVLVSNGRVTGVQG